MLNKTQRNGWNSEFYQRTLFGHDIKIEDIPKKPAPNKYKTMQQLHGTLPDKTCGECKYFMRLNYHGRTYFKCQLWHISHSEVTDIRKKDTACNLWKARDSE